MTTPITYSESQVEQMLAAQKKDLDNQMDQVQAKAVGDIQASYEKGIADQTIANVQPVKDAYTKGYNDGINTLPQTVQANIVKQKAKLKTLLEPLIDELGSESIGS